jgi:hypothetical protein
MTHRSFHVAALVGASVLACVGCSDSSPKQAKQVDRLAAKFAASSLKTATEVQSAVSAAAAAQRAIVFIHVDWAPMQVQRSQYAQFVVEYQRLHPHENLQFHYIDCTTVTDGYKPLEDLPGWKELEDSKGIALLHAGGELVWLDHGRVLHVERIPEDDSTLHLVKRTEAFLPNRDSE